MLSENDLLEKLIESSKNMVNDLIGIFKDSALALSLPSINRYNNTIKNSEDVIRRLYNEFNEAIKRVKPKNVEELVESLSVINTTMMLIAYNNCSKVIENDEICKAIPLILLSIEVSKTITNYEHLLSQRQ